MKTNPNHKRIPRPVVIVACLVAVLFLMYGGFHFYSGGSNVVQSNTFPERSVSGNDSSNIEKQQVVVWYIDAIEKLENRVNRLEEMAIQDGGGMQETYQATLLDMEEELDTLRSQIKQIRRASPREWNGLRVRIQETRDRVEDRLQNDYREYSVSR
ncbi:hypothetical protein BH09BAC1_BH09BAC1_24140 [soil metagenome]